MSGVDDRALEAARRAVEDALIAMRDARISRVCANGFVVREPDGSESAAVRLTTREGLRIGIKAYLGEVGRDCGETCG